MSFSLSALLNAMFNGALQATNSLTIRLQEDVDVDAFTIESMRSQEYSIGIFAFMIGGILVFAGIIYHYMRNSSSERMKLGEKILFAWIILGTITAAVFGAVQLLFGYLI